MVQKAPQKVPFVSRLEVWKIVGPTSQRQFWKVSFLAILRKRFWKNFKNTPYNTLFFFIIFYHHFQHLFNHFINSFQLSSFIIKTSHSINSILNIQIHCYDSFHIKTRVMPIEHQSQLGLAQWWGSWMILSWFQHHAQNKRKPFAFDHFIQIIMIYQKLSKRPNKH